ncbi:MAG: hypothetical protein WDW38_008280 [Sanguina aurantia]
MNSLDETKFSFGAFTIQPSEVFVTSQHSFAFVNLKPIVPGHVLVSPKRVVQRFTEMTSEEVADLWILVQRVGKVVESHYSAASLTLAMQDGPLAGQSVPHVHVHVLPRRAGDFARNDDVYDALEQGSKEMAPEITKQQQGERLDLDQERRVATPQEMAAEAATLRALFVTA